MLLKLNCYLSVLFLPAHMEMFRDHGITNIVYQPFLPRTWGMITMRLHNSHNHRAFKEWPKNLANDAMLMSVVLDRILERYEMINIGRGKAIR